MTDAHLTFGTADAPSVAERLADRDLSASTAAVTFDVPEGKKVIFDPEHESLTYGPHNDIQFGPKGGFEPNIVIIDEDHPLLEQMLTAHPRMFFIGEPDRVYACHIDGSEFKSFASYRGHFTAKHGGVVKA